VVLPWDTEETRVSEEARATLVTVERDPDSHRELDRMLVAAGYRVVPASLAEGAQQLVVETQPDLVIVGSTVPEREGVALARRLREEASTARTPIMFVLPEGGAVGEETAEVAGVSIAGPLHPSVLRANVQAMLRLHAAEERRSHTFRLLQTVQSAFPWSLAQLDRDLAFVQVNQAFADAVGKRPEELVGRHYTEVLPETELVAKRLRRVLRTGKATRLREIPAPALTQRRRGPRRYLDVSFVPLHDETGAVEGVIVAALDVSAEIRLRAARAQEERRRRELAEAMNQEMNHRIKNNLMTVVELLQFQAHALEDDSARAALHDAVSRLNLFAHIHEQLQSIETEEVDLLELLQRVAAVSRSAAPEREVMVSVHGEAMPLPTEAATSLALAANELITNGIKHGGAGADGRVRIEVWLTRGAGRLAMLVWNSGNPVPADFDALRPGAMGLRLVQAIAVAHYGGSFDLCPDAGGTAAQVLISESRLREG
jgi:PAS domain S-box-containing protein